MKINPGSLGFPDYYAYLHVINKIYQLFIYSLSLVFQLSAKTEKVPAESIPYFPAIYFKTDRYSIDKVQEWKIEDIACYVDSWRIIAIGMGETVIGSEASASRRAESEILSR